MSKYVYSIKKLTTNVISGITQKRKKKKRKSLKQHGYIWPSQMWGSFMSTLRKTITLHPDIMGYTAPQELLG